MYHETKPEIQFDSPVDGVSLSSVKDTWPEGHISISKPRPPCPMPQNTSLPFLLPSIKSR